MMLVAYPSKDQSLASHSGTLQTYCDEEALQNLSRADRISAWTAEEDFDESAIASNRKAV